MRLKNKICIISGSSSGIGEELAKGFAKEGAEVIITYLTNKKNAIELGKKINITQLALWLECSTRTIHRNMGEELKREKELLNQQL